LSILNRPAQFFSGRLSENFVIKLLLRIPPHPKHVAILPLKKFREIATTEAQQRQTSEN